MPTARLVCKWTGKGQSRLEYVTHNGVAIEARETELAPDSLVVSYTVPEALVHLVGAFLAFHGDVLHDLELRLALDGHEKIIARSDEQQHFWRARGLWT